MTLRARLRRSPLATLQLESLESRDCPAGDPIALAFSPVGPAIGAIQHATATSAIESAGDAARFQFDMNQYQTLSLAIDGAAGMQTALSILDADGNLVASSAAGAAGERLVFNRFDDFPISGPATYTAVVTSANGALGAVTLAATYDAIFETEPEGGAAVDDLTTIYSPIAELAYHERRVALGTTDTTDDTFTITNNGQRGILFSATVTALEGASSGLNLSVYAPDGTLVSAADAISAAGGPLAQGLTMRQNGVYRFVVSGDSDVEYALVISVGAVVETARDNEDTALDLGGHSAILAQLDRVERPAHLLGIYAYAQRLIEWIDPQTGERLSNAEFSYQGGEDDSIDVALAYDGTSIWMTETDGDSDKILLVELDPETGTLLHGMELLDAWAGTPFSGSVTGLASLGNYVYLYDADSSLIYQVDIGLTRTFAEVVDDWAYVVNMIDIGNVNPGVTWAADAGLTAFAAENVLLIAGEQVIYKLDPATGLIVGQISIVAGYGAGLATVGNEIFVSSSTASSVKVYDATGQWLRDLPAILPFMALAGDDVSQIEFDRYTIDLQAGEFIAAAVLTPFGGQPLNYGMTMRSPNGFVFTSLQYPESPEPLIAFQAEESGSYTLIVYAEDDRAGDYLLVFIQPRSLDSIEWTSDVVDEGTTNSLAANFSRGSAIESSIYDIDWGDGSAEQGYLLPVFSAGYNDHVYADEGTYTATVSYYDPYSGLFTQLSLPVTVQNAAPTFTSVAAPATVELGAAFQIDVLFADAGVLDTHTATIDFGDGNGPQAVLVDPLTKSLSAGLVYGAAGTYEVLITIVDDDGGARSYTHTVEVLAPPPVVGVLLGEDGTLSILGTDEGDTVLVGRNASGDVTVLASFNPEPSTPLVFAASAVARLVIEVRGGDDLVVVAPGVALPTYIDGGAGDDLLSGGSGGAVVVGGDGNDVLTGGGGRDLLVGGSGSDLLLGFGGEDILLSDATHYGGDEQTALSAILADWQRTDLDYATRVARAQSGDIDGGWRLDATTLVADAETDILLGLGGRDWFLGDAMPDVMLAAGNELVTDLGAD